MANTLKFGDGKWGAKKDSILAYNDENANFKPLPFTTSRSSTATRINKAGLIEKVENGIPRVDYLGNTKGAMLLEPQSTNLIRYSEAFGQSYWTKNGATIQGDPSTAGAEKVVNGDFASDTSWTKGTGWSIGSGVASYVSPGTNNNSPIFQNVTLTIGITYRLTFNISNTTNSSIWIGNSQGSSNYEGVSYIVRPNGSYETTFTMSSTQTTLAFYANSTSNSFDLDNVSVKEVQGFASPSSDSPLGAFKLVENSGTGQHRMSVSISSPSAIHTISAFFKPIGTNRKAYLDLGTVTGFFDFTTKVFTSATGVGSYEEVSDGWYKLSLTSNSAVTISAIYIGLAISNETYNGNGTSGVYIFGAQLEQKSYATSYMPNYGESAGVTRLAESCGQIPISGVIGQTEGTVYWEINVKTTVATANENILNIDAGSFGNTIYFSKSATGNLVGEIYLSGVLQASFTKTNITKGVHKMAMGYANNNTALFIDAIQIGTTDTSCTVPATNRIQLGNTAIGPSDCLSNDLKLYNTRLSNSELQALTTI